MLCWTGLEQVPPGFGPSVVSVGVFDGVHRGHGHVLGRAVERATRLDVPPVVVTFDPNPVAVLRPDAAPAELSTLEHRLELFGALLDRRPGAATLVLPFTRELAAESAEGFVDRVLVGALGARAVVVGANFRWGARAAGDVALLEALGARRGFAVEAVALAGDAGSTWSSTEIRRRIAAGDVEGAALALGRPHRVEGLVVPGDRRGRTIGYPTANLAGGGRAAVPADGIYAGWLTVPARGGTRLPAAISVGTNPTFGGSSRRVEAYVLDRDDLDLYGRVVAVEFLARLRDSERFETVAALVAQMDRDVARTRELLAPAGAE